MAEKKQYRSAIRSRTAIRSAFTALLNEKPLDKITVTDVVQRADINRSTFYAHYPDIRGLLEEIWGEILSQIPTLMEQVVSKSLFNDPAAYIRALYSALNADLPLYQALARSHMHVELGAQMKKTLLNAVLSASPVPDNAIARVRISFIIGGTVDVSLMWLRGEFDCSIEAITEDLANTLIKANASAILDEWMH